MQVAIVGTGWAGSHSAFIEQVASKIGITTEEVIVIVDKLDPFSISEEERFRIENIRKKLAEPIPIQTKDILFAEKSN